MQGTLRRVMLQLGAQKKAPVRLNGLGAMLRVLSTRAGADTNEEWKTLAELFGNCYHAGFSKDASLSFYDESAKYYDNLARPSSWLAPAMVANYAAQLLRQQRGTSLHNARALDFGAGTGQLGLALKEQGFEQLDAVEPSFEMTKQIPGGTYLRVYSDDKDVHHEGYHVIASTGVIGTHVYPDGLRLLLQKVKPLGFVIFSCKADAWLKEGFAAMMVEIAGEWHHKLIFGPAPLVKDMPKQEHVIVVLCRWMDTTHVAKAARCD